MKQFSKKAFLSHSLLGFSGWFKSLCNFFFFSLRNMSLFDKIFLVLLLKKVNTFCQTDFLQMFKLIVLWPYMVNGHSWFPCLFWPSIVCRDVHSLFSCSVPPLPLRSIVNFVHCDLCPPSLWWRQQMLLPSSSLSSLSTFTTALISSATSSPSSLWESSTSWWWRQQTPRREWVRLPNGSGGG